MPLDTELGLNQPTIDWVIRMAIYIIIGFIIGFFSDYNKKNSEYISNLLTRDTITNLKNFEAIKRKDFNKDIPKTIIALSVKEYEETLRFFGYDFTNNAISQFSKRLVSILKKYDNTEVFRYDGMEFVIVISNTKASKAKSDVDEIINTLNTINKSTIKVDDIPIYIILLAMCQY
jgi:GGDEF domain-containing protein